MINYNIIDMSSDIENAINVIILKHYTKFKNGSKFRI